MIGQVFDPHTAGGPGCRVCLETLEIWAEPQVVGWQHLYGNLWRTEKGFYFEFIPGAQHIMLVACPNCFPSAYPKWYSIN